MQRVIQPNHLLLPEVEKLLAEGENVTIRVKGNSMLPFITGGRDSVELRKAQSLSKGDIVLARLPDERYVLHRIIGFSDGYVRLMGDGNLRGEEKCQNKDIAGKAFGIIRKDKVVDCSRSCERTKAKVWMLLLPVRRYLLALYRRIN